MPDSETNCTVVFVTRIINRDKAPLREPEIYMHAPIKVPHQQITELRIDGHPERLTDGWGAPVLHYHPQELPSGGCLVGRWTAWATIRRFQWDWRNAVATTGPSLPPAEQERCLRDGTNLALGDPIIIAAAEEAARGKTGTVQVLEGAFDVVMNRLTYERDNKWQPAPEVLASGKGSCSEFTYCFLALARKNGIPARYVGGIVGRQGIPYHLDRVFHRFSQAYLDGYGWMDLDPTRNDRANNKRLFFGQTPGPMLLLAVGDGMAGSLTGADYLESHSWPDKKARASSLRQAWWFEPPTAAVRAQVEQFQKRLASATNGQRSDLVLRALEIGHPFVLPWLDDLLYEPGPRVEAARACLKIGGQGELGAVVNCLGRLNDTKGDRRIGELLEGFTGQKFGSDREKWNEWIKAQTPRTPLPGDTPDRKP